MSYTHLSQAERYPIHHLHHAPFSACAISQRIARASGAVRRELRRNADRSGYHAADAQRRSAHRRPVAGSRPRIDESTGPIVRSLLAEKFSPVKIVGCGAANVSQERLYQYIAADRRVGGTLWTVAPSQATPPTPPTVRDASATPAFSGSAHRPATCTLVIAPSRGRLGRRHYPRPRQHADRHVGRTQDRPGAHATCRQR
ncbi:MAG: helix-turn-helix domain-containing protein [Dokdonella sp.]